MTIYNNDVAQITQVTNNGDDVKVIQISNLFSTVLRNIVMSYFGVASGSVKIGVSAATDGSSPVFIASYDLAEFTSPKSIATINTPINCGTTLKSIVIVTNTLTGEKFNYAISFMQLPLTGVIPDNAFSLFNTQVFPATVETTFNLYTNTNSVPDVIKNIYCNFSAATSGEYIKLEVSNGAAATTAPVGVINLQTAGTVEALYSTNESYLVVQPGQTLQATCSSLASPVSFSYLVSGASVS